MHAANNTLATLTRVEVGDEARAADARFAVDCCVHRHLHLDRTRRVALRLSVYWSIVFDVALPERK